jgi:hypothetical protein
LIGATVVARVGLIVGSEEAEFALDSPSAVELGARSEVDSAPVVEEDELALDSPSVVELGAGSEVDSAPSEREDSVPVEEAELALVSPISVVEAVVLCAALAAAFRARARA